ncbi:MAG: hypothetical protein RLZZ453_187 [Chlamydiota bacterium]|jgi:hypothetical protein
MSLEENIIKYKQLQEAIKKLEEEKQNVYKEILQAFPPDEKEIFSENYQVKKHLRVTIRTTLEEARSFQATKIEEVIDKQKIKEYIRQGIAIPNVTETGYFFVHPRSTDMTSEVFA